MSGLTKDIPVPALDRRVTVRELDVSAIRQHLASAGAPESIEEIDVVGTLLFHEASFADLKAMSDITDDELARLAPSEIRPVLIACKEVNPDFFGMAARIRAHG